MLLDFKTSNFKSFVDVANFSMLPAPKLKGLDYSVCRESIDGKEVKALCSSAIYGPNASGKTNLISAMDVLKEIVARGSIRNSKEIITANPASAWLELIPNKENENAKPVEFLIEFTEKSIKIKYELSALFGSFMEKGNKRKIIKEALHVNGNLVFERGSNDDLTIGKLKFLPDYFGDIDDNKSNSRLEFAKDGLNPEELFLTNGFKLLFSSGLANVITNWLSEKFIVIFKANTTQIVQYSPDLDKDGFFIEDSVNEAARMFGINSNAIGYVSSKDDQEIKLCSFIKKGEKSVVIPSDVFESYGTLRFVNIFPLVAKAIFTGSCLIIDEFDASMHPSALMSIINIFHNDEINVHHAQLIFNTHNPIFLNRNIFRRDEIKFVERDDNSHQSELYALSDFGTSGENGVRKYEDYLNNYFIGKYGAIKTIDFTSIFEDIMSGIEKNEN